ncbi:VOC family protein [Pajaroellobacter abortibovis]|uniref:VOC domain-containing protein n=1 Tax=Pajaroellobacter abortibovis TaxID=1882918 RepID=A0A1L6MZ15_9BACT|nr:VOC family protein [Pajaroellobacter abortibovis]APS00625.1 hypothetical protein BCY86_08030 [Pajaroellobacter abortibovis]
MQGIHPFWMSDVTVNDVDRVVERVMPYGGKVRKGPFDVMEFGRMAVIEDPTGAVLSLWQAKQHQDWM